MGLRAALEPQLAAVGITRVADLAGLDEIDLPVFAAVRPRARSLAVSQGKGLDPESAWVGAVLEAAELHAAEHVEAARRPKTEAVRRLLPADIDAAASADVDGWVEGWALPGGETIWVPRDMVALDLTRPCRLRRWRRTSSGLGAGATVEAACRHALLEVVERHVLASVADAPRRARELSLAPSPDGELGAVLEPIRAAGMQPLLWLLPSPPGLFVVKARLPGTVPTAPAVLGAACDLSASRAAVRALLECVQSRATRLAGARDDLVDADYACDDETALADRLRAARTGETVGWPEAEGLAATSAAVVAALTAAGFPDAVVVALPTPLLGVEVVRALVPGSRDSFAPLSVAHAA
jgi:ribosomal protein S12 methylthiotransferase accessory factor